MHVDLCRGCLYVQTDPHRPITSRSTTWGSLVKNVGSGFEAAVVDGAGGQADGGTCDGRGRVRRVVAKPARGPGGGRLSA
jgi:hypothetical protein